MIFISKFLRSFLQLSDSLRNFIYISFIKIKHPSVDINYKTYLGKGCKIKCHKKSKMIILNSHISSGSFLGAGHGGVLIIKNSFIGRNCVIAARKKIHISENCQIAEMVVIRDQNHNFGEIGKTIIEQGFNSSSIKLEENVWLAAKVTVLAGSIIGKNTVVGANAVVKGVLESNSVYVGIPVKKIKSF